jgi:LysR family hydrogen peroxide-inducible transcriptional activator
MRHLLAVREHGSFAKAAQVLQISQPSLSASISRLEDRLKVKLFERSAAGSFITPVGEFVADRASRVIAEVERVTRAAALVSGGNTGIVRIGFGSSLRHTLMPRLIVDLATAKPALNLSLHVDATDYLLGLLRAREIDIAICAVPGAEIVEGLIVSDIFTITPVAVASPSHALAGERSLTTQRFLEFPAAGPSIKGVARSVLGTVDEHEPVPQYDSNDYDALIPLALKGLATLIAPDFVVRPHVESGALVELDLKLSPIGYAAVTNEVNSFSPIVREIIRRAQQAGSISALGDA